MTALAVVAIRVSVVLGAALAAAWLTRRRSAALRHWILAAAVVAAAVLPLLGLVLPAWGPSLGSVPQGAAAPAVAETVAFRLVDAGAAVGAPGPPVATSTASPWFPQLVVSAWMIGAALGLAVLAFGRLRLGKLARRAVPAAPAVHAIGAGLARDLGIRRPVRFLRADHAALVVAWGLLRPTVLLPASSLDWSPERLRIVLAHELAHVARGDWAVQMTAALVRALHWFNPLAWLACRRLRQAGEYACDDVVLTLGVPGPEYAEHLLDLARVSRAHGHPWVPAPAIARPSTLRRRIGAMLTTTLDRRPLTRTAQALTAGLVLAVTLAVAGLGAQSFATLSGTVLDQSGAYVPNVTLTLTNPASEAKYEVRSNATGRFEFVGLPPGDYRLQTRHLGFDPTDQTVTLVGGQALDRTITMPLGHLVERVRVTGQPAVEQPRTGRAAPPAATPCVPTAVGGNIKAPLKIKDVRPALPSGSDAAQLQGTVVLEARIGLDGDVEDVRVTESAHPDMDAAATEAVQEWKFTKTLLNCRPVEVFMTVTVAFEPAK